MQRVLLLCASFCLVGSCLLEECAAQDVRVPASVTAGEESSISTTGTGKATFYLIGPGISRKSDVSLGEQIPLSGEDLRHAGNYVAIVCSPTCQSATFQVAAAKPASLTFLVHPSRVPVAQSDVVSGVALPFDQFHNLVLTPAFVNFQLSAGHASVMSHAVSTHDGVAWFRAASGKSAGNLQVIAEVGDVSVRRAVQQVACESLDSEPQLEFSPRPNRFTIAGATSCPTAPSSLLRPLTLTEKIPWTRR